MFCYPRNQEKNVHLYICGYLKTGTGVLEAGHDWRGYPAWVGQDEGQEKVGVDLVPETAHFSENGWGQNELQLGGGAHLK